MSGTSQGAFVWYELMTTELAAATAYYGGVLGWTAADAGNPNLTYMLLKAGERPVAGAMTLPAEACTAGARPGWLGYLAVADVDAAAARVAQLGGSIHRAADDIPGVGRFAVAADPQGAVFVLFAPGPAMPSPPPAPPGTPGHAAWRELYAADGPAVLPFYEALFGWTRGEAMDMGPLGVYQIVVRDGVPLGGIMTRPPEAPAAAVPPWHFYFTVDNIDAALARASAGGGQVLMGPQEVPGGDWIIQGLDPQGVFFALVGPRLSPG